MGRGLAVLNLAGQDIDHELLASWFVSRGRFGRFVVIPTHRFILRRWSKSLGLQWEPSGTSKAAIKTAVNRPELSPRRLAC